MTDQRPHIDDRLYEASSQDLLEVVVELCAKGFERLMLVGHNPGLDRLLESLVNSPLNYTLNDTLNYTLNYTDDGKLITTANLVRIGLSRDGSSGELLAHIRPAELRV